MHPALRYAYYSSSSQGDQWYLFHDAIAKTYRNNSDYQTANMNRQVFPISNFEDDDYFYVYFAGDGNVDGTDRTFLTRKSKSDGLHINKGWEWYDGDITTIPTSILGRGGSTNEIKANVNTRANTTAALAANTANGAYTTLTANANGALAAQNGVTLVAGDRLLVKNESDQKKNGVYSVTQVGDASNPWILTRTTDADSASELNNLIVTPTAGTTPVPWFQTTANPAIATDNIVFVEYSWNFQQNFLGQILPKDGGGYIALYSANGPVISSAYSMGTAESIDLINFTRSSRSPVIAASGGVTLIHPRGMRDINDPSILHIFVHDTSGGTTGRLYQVRHYTTTWNDNPALWPAPTLQDDDFYDGKIPLEDSLGEMSIIWVEEGEYHWYSSVDAKWGYPANQGRVTQQSIQGTIIHYKSSDFTSITEVERLHTTTQLAEMAHIALCGKMEHNSKPFTAITAYKWKGKSTLVTESEPFTNVKILTQEAPEDNEPTTEALLSIEVWPEALINGFLFRTDQAQEASLSPIEAISGESLTIVGEPSRAFYSSMQPASEAYVRYDGNIVLDTKYFGIKFLYEIVFDADTFSIFCLMRASDSKVVLKVETFGSRLRVTLVGDNGTSQKIYRLSSTITTADPAPSVNADGRVPFLILWRNGTLQLGANYNGNMTVIKDTDNAFTDIFSGGDTLKIGVGATDTDFCQHVIGPIMVLNGIDRATESNLINLDLT